MRVVACLHKSISFIFHSFMHSVMGCSIYHRIRVLMCLSPSYPPTWSYHSSEQINSVLLHHCVSFDLDYRPTYLCIEVCSSRSSNVWTIWAYHFSGILRWNWLSKYPRLSLLFDDAQDEISWYAMFVTVVYSRTHFRICFVRGRRFVALVLASSSNFSLGKLLI